MKLLVLGATGGIGMEVVRQAVERGHTVTALVRAAARLEPFGNRITTIEGDLLDSHTLRRALTGQDAVLSAFGPRVPIAKSDAHLLRDFGAALTDAMKKAVVQRGIVVSTAFLFKDAVLPPAYLFGRLLFPGVVTDATEMEKILRTSGLDLTIVRPPQLTDKPYTGRYRVRAGHLPFFGFKIARADVADFMIRTAESGGFLRAVVGVCK
ncbi:MAG TPA: SDR family oxidoreductase [Terracidiphilus sp.]|nr:SDR family oxidoreductase [Terracidiphilus sp.]